MKVKIIFCFLFFATSALAEKRNQKNVIIKYKHRQKIDLGELSVEGSILAPGDISIDYEKNESSIKLHKRKTYKDKIKLNLDITI